MSRPRPGPAPLLPGKLASPPSPNVPAFPEATSSGSCVGPWKGGGPWALPCLVWEARMSLDGSLLRAGLLLMGLYEAPAFPSARCRMFLWPFLPFRLWKITASPASPGVPGRYSAASDQCESGCSGVCVLGQQPRRPPFHLPPQCWLFCTATQSQKPLTGPSGHSQQLFVMGTWSPGGSP